MYKNITKYDTVRGYNKFGKEIRGFSRDIHQIGRNFIYLIEFKQFGINDYTNLCYENTIDRCKLVLIEKHVTLTDI